jgi:hypothetical protein
MTKLKKMKVKLLKRIRKNSYLVKKSGRYGCVASSGLFSYNLVSFCHFTKSYATKMLQKNMLTVARGCVKARKAKPNATRA